MVNNIHECPVKVSVVLPVYNGAKTLKSSINSILQQTFDNFELIIVDDASNDESYLISQHAAENDLRIRSYKNDENKGLPATLNLGFSKATGEYWTWTSHDNLYKPGALLGLVGILDYNDDVVLAYSDMDYIDPNGEFLKAIKFSEPDAIYFANNIGACFLYRASYARQVGEYNTALESVEDYEYWLRLYAQAYIQGCRFYHLNENLYQYMSFHPGSLSVKYKNSIYFLGIQVRYFYALTAPVKVNWFRFWASVLKEIPHCSDNVLRDTVKVFKQLARLKRKRRAASSDIALNDLLCFERSD